MSVDPQVPNPTEVIPTDKQGVTVEGTKNPQEATPDSKEASLSPKFAALAKKEKVIREHARRLQAEREALASEKAEIESVKGWKTKLTEDPLSVLQEAGISGDQLTQFLLNQANPEEIKFQKLQQEIKALRSEQEKAQERSKQAQEQSYQQAIKQLNTQVSMLVDGNEEYETIKSMNAESAVVQLIEETFKEDGTLMDVESAAKEVENYLVEQALTFAKLKKIQAKLNPPPVEPEKKQTPPQKHTTVTPTTLSNRITQSSTQPMTSKERRERAIAIASGKLTI